ncbi:protein-glutamine gamma-glutamyltransferase E-like [Discoglossus pictus]
MEEMSSQVCKPLSSETQISGKFKLIGAREVGKDVNLVLVITNPSKDLKNLSVKITAFSILYTKKEMHELLNECRRISLKCNEEKEMPVTITYAQYEDLMTADNTIEVTAVCSSEQDSVIMQTNVVLENPKIEIKLEGIAKVNKPVIAQVIFKNPLEKEVLNVVLIAEGSGLIKDPVTIKAGNIKAKETITIPITITPYKAGTKYLLTDLTCSKFFNVKGYLEIEVQEE